MGSDEEDEPELAADTLALLQEFQKERDARTQQFEQLKTQSEAKFDDAQLSMDVFSEDWNASQFWYTDETAQILARQLLEGTDVESGIAVVSAPSVYIQLRRLLKDTPPADRPTVRLLEFDKRFEVFDEFVFYDFAQPLRLPLELKGRFDRIICDPPFLSEDCQTKTALTVRYLATSWSLASANKQNPVRIISCTGERMEANIIKLYAKLNVRTTTYEPYHSKGLSNEFRCYANFECDEWTWR